MLNITIKPINQQDDKFKHKEMSQKISNLHVQLE